MPRVTLTFKLPEEQEEYETARKAGAMESVLWDYSQWLRALDKYGGEEAEKFSIQSAREKFFRVCEEHGVDV